MGKVGRPGKRRQQVLLHTLLLSSQSMGTENGDATDFKEVGVEIWTSFNSLHTRNNMDTVNWGVEKGVNTILTHSDHVVDFGCGTGEVVNKLAGVGMFGSAQILGLDNNFSFIKHATKQGRRSNNASFFWSEYLDDLKFLDSRCSLVTVFTVLHILPPVIQTTSLDFINSLLKKSGKLLILHYLGRSEQCFNEYIDIFEEMKASEQWKHYIGGAIHKSIETLRKEKEDSLNNILKKLKSSRFNILECEKVYKNVIIVENTWKVIFNNRDIRKMEFGLAYSGIPLIDRPQFIAE